MEVLLLLSLLILTGMMGAEGEPHWGILSAFPRPMPVHHNSKVFPHLFTTNSSLELPYLPMDKEIASITENRSLLLSGSLCFFIPAFLNLSKYNISQSECIILGKQTAVWTITPDLSDNPSSYYVGMSMINGWWPFKHIGNRPPTQPRYSPHCMGARPEGLWPWTGCQSQTSTWANKNLSFAFSPGISQELGDGNASILSLTSNSSKMYKQPNHSTIYPPL